MLANRRPLLGLAVAGVLHAAVCWSHPVPVGSQFTANGHTTGLQFNPAIASTGASGFVVVWSDLSGRDGDQFGVFGRRFDASGAPLAGDFAVNVHTTGSQHRTSVAADASGNFVVVWQDYSGQDGDGYGIVARRFDAAGVPLGGDFVVNTQTTGDQVVPSVAMHASGNFLVAWYRDGDSQVAAQRFDAAGVPQGSEIQVSTTSGGGPIVAVDAAGDFGVVWTPSGGDGVLGQRVDASGAPIGTEFTVTSAGGLNGMGSDALGNLVVVWGELGDGADLFGRRVSNLGVPLGSAFPINDFTMGDQGAAGVWVEPSGGFVVAFDSPRGYQVDFGNALSAAIDARRFDAAGMPVGTEFKVNMESATVDAGVPRLAAGPSGEFMVVWDDAAPGSNFDLDDIGARFFGFVAPVGGTKLLLRDDQDNPAKRRLVFRATDQVLSTNPGAGVNPLQDGAYLHVYNTAGTGDSACIALSAANWVQKGQTGALVYRYADPSYALGPCKKVSVKQGKIIKASCKALLQPIPYSLDEIEQGSVAVRFVSGDAAYCAHFEGAAVTTDGSRRFVARFAPAPAACPAPVGACP